MAREIVIDPVTRIEGHARITIKLDDRGGVKDAQFHVTQFRGFERFTNGRPFEEMPAIMARICGICPVSHLLAAAKAGDALLSVTVPPAGEKLRRLLHMGQITQSHALSFYHLTSPDLLLGFDSPVAERHIFGVVAKFPELAKEGIWLRKFGQMVIEHLSGRRIHPSWAVPGGVGRAFNQEARDQILADIPRALDLTRKAIDLFKSIVSQFPDEIEAYGTFPTKYMGSVTPDGKLDLYGGKLRWVDEYRNVVVDQVPPAKYADYIGEATESFSFLKSPYYRPDGYEDGIYRVGPLARLNVVDTVGTPLADAELLEYRQLGDAGSGTVQSAFYAHYARLIEILFALESMRDLLQADDILSPRVRAIASPNCNEGVGVVEAPRGTLIHHYKIDDNGLMTWANLIVATGHNNLAMNRGVAAVAKKFVKSKTLEEGMLNRVEALIRCYDPCLSCSTHAIGQMPLHIELRGPDGALLDEIMRG